MSLFSHNKAIIVNIKFAIVLHAHYAVSAGATGLFNKYTTMDNKEWKSMGHYSFFPLQCTQLNQIYTVKW